MKWMIIILLFLSACSTTTPTKFTNTDYKPMEKELIKDVKPYSSKAEPTLKEINKQKDYEECMERASQINKNNHDYSPNIFTQILQDYGCS